METINLILTAILGSGVLVAIIEWTRHIASEKEIRKVEFLSNQLKYLYGPLYCFSSYAEQLFELVNDIQSKYKDEYIDKNWSQEKATQEALKIEIKDTVDVVNAYIIKVIENNELLLKILEEYYFYIDLDDIEIFKKFIRDFVRYKTELDKNKGIKLPYRIFLQLDNISFIKPEFIGRVKSKFEKKQSEIKKYRAK